MKKGLIDLTVLFLLLNSSLLSSQNLNNTKTIHYYTPEDLEYVTQTWTFSQAQNNVMFMGNSYGVFSYNGERTNLITLPNNSIVNSLTTDKNGKIWAGGIDEVGFLTTTQKCVLIFQSIKDKIPQEGREFGMVNNIIPLAEEVVIHTPWNLFIYQKGDIKCIKPEIKFEKSYFYNDTVFIVDAGKLKYLNYNNELETYVNFHAKGLNNLNWLFSTNNNLFLGIDKNNNLFNISKDRIIPVASEIKRKNIEISAGLQYNDSLFVIGTVSHGIFFLNKNGKIIKNIELKSSNTSDRVLELFKDINNNLWIGFDNGFAFMELNTPFSTISYQEGISGTGYSSVIHNGVLYLATSQGLFYKKNCSLSTSGYYNQKYQLVESTTGQAWSLNIVNDQIFLNHEKGTFLIENAKAKPIMTETGSWLIKPLSQKPNYAIQGTYMGLLVYEISPFNVQLKNKIKGFNESSRIFHEDDEGTIWIAHGNKGLFKLNLSDKADFVIDEMFFDENSIFPSSLGINVVKLDNNVYFISEHGGIYYYNYATNEIESTERYNHFWDDKKPKLRYLKQDQFDNYWYILNSGLIGVIKAKNDTITTKNEKKFNKLRASLIGGFEHINPINKHQVLFGYNNGFILFDSSINYKAPEYNKVIIDKVEYINHPDSIIANQDNKRNNIKYKNNSLRFFFTIPTYTDRDKIQYSCYLEGFDKRWSPFTNRSSKEYTNLPNGDYTFHVKSIDIYNNESEVSSFSFTIEKPWYKTTPLKILYFSIFLGSLYLFSRIIKKKQAKIFHEKQLKAEKLTIELRNKLLKTEISQKEAEVDKKTAKLNSLAIQILNKNDIIERIKTELKEAMQDSNTNLKKKIKSIISSLKHEKTNEEDWQRFELYFNEVHKNFLQKLKSKYPDLNSIELRICSLIKTELSSKEIATIFNTSLRAIESHRYRIRKKMNLQTDNNLKDFLFTFNIT